MGGIILSSSVLQVLSITKILNKLKFWPDEVRDYQSYNNSSWGGRDSSYMAIYPIVANIFQSRQKKCWTDIAIPRAKLLPLVKICRLQERKCIWHGILHKVFAAVSLNCQWVSACTAQKQNKKKKSHTASLLFTVHCNTITLVLVTQVDRCTDWRRDRWWRIKGERTGSWLAAATCRVFCRLMSSGLRRLTWGT